MTYRAMIVAAIGAVVVLAVGSTAFIALLIGSTSPTVKGTVGSGCSVPSLSGLTVDVTLSDAGDAMMGQEPMMATLIADPATVPAGKVSFLAFNNGALARGWSCSHFPRTVLARGRLEPMARSASPRAWARRHDSCAPGAGDGIAPGSVGWTTMTLKPGRYELVCDEPWRCAGGCSMY